MWGVVLGEGVDGGEESRDGDLRAVERVAREIDVGFRERS